MAKKRKRTSAAKRVARIRTAPLAEAVAADETRVIEIPSGSTLDVLVDVGPMVFPYTVAYARRTLIKSLVDRKEPAPLQVGDRVLSWSFAHGVKEWTHSIGISVNGGPTVVLESKAEANRDPDHSVDFVVIRVGGTES